MLITETEILEQGHADNSRRVNHLIVSTGMDRQPVQLMEYWHHISDLHMVFGSFKLVNSLIVSLKGRWNSPARRA